MCTKSGFSITCVHYEANGWCIGTCGTSKKTQKGRKGSFVAKRKNNERGLCIHLAELISWGVPGSGNSHLAHLIIINNRIPTYVQPQAPGEFMGQWMIIL